MDIFLGTIMPVAFPFAPKNWALCNGQSLQIQQYQALFSLIGTYFGGDGIRTFNLPDLRGRTPTGISGDPGKVSGSETVTLTIAQIPQHSHALNATTKAAPTVPPVVPPTGKIFGQDTASSNPRTIFAPTAASPVTLAMTNVGISGQSIPHENMQPYLTVNYIIALSGIYPSRS